MSKKLYLLLACSLAFAACNTPEPLELSVQELQEEEMVEIEITDESQNDMAEIPPGLMRYEDKEKGFSFNVPNGAEVTSLEDSYEIALPDVEELMKIEWGYDSYTFEVYSGYNERIVVNFPVERHLNRFINADQNGQVSEVVNFIAALPSNEMFGYNFRLNLREKEADFLREQIAFSGERSEEFDAWAIDWIVNIEEKDKVKYEAFLAMAESLEFHPDWTLRYEDKENGFSFEIPSGAVVTALESSYEILLPGQVQVIVVDRKYESHSFEIYGGYFEEVLNSNFDQLFRHIAPNVEQLVSDKLWFMELDPNNELMAHSFHLNLREQETNFLREQIAFSGERSEEFDAWAIDWIEDMNEFYQAQYDAFVLMAESLEYHPEWL
jgi:hypothetical protein